MTTCASSPRKISGTISAQTSGSTSSRWRPKAIRSRRRPSPPALSTSKSSTFVASPTRQPRTSTPCAQPLSACHPNAAASGPLRSCATPFIPSSRTRTPGNQLSTLCCAISTARRTRNAPSRLPKLVTGSRAVFSPAHAQPAFRHCSTSSTRRPAAAFLRRASR